MDNVWHFLVAASVFMIIDAVWLTFIANKFYKKHLGSLLATKPNLKAAAIFYVIYMIGVVVFAINPAIDKNSINYAISHGALLGLTLYATYDLTNQATLKNWPTIVTIVDMAWGTIITAVVTTLTYLVFS